MDEKKWRPVHLICMEELSESLTLVSKLSHWAEVYSAGGIVPPEDILGLIKTFSNAISKINREAEMPDLKSTVQQAIDNLNQQIEEAAENPEEKPATHKRRATSSSLEKMGMEGIDAVFDDICENCSILKVCSESSAKCEALNVICIVAVNISMDALAAINTPLYLENLKKAIITIKKMRT
ncbi:MAG: hypothetical protein V1804_03710 [Patescibacteria group bacterium]